MPRLSILDAPAAAARLARRRLVEILAERHASGPTHVPGSLAWTARRLRDVQRVLGARAYDTCPCPAN